MPLTEHQKAVNKVWRDANKESIHAAFKRWHEAHGQDHYYENVELTRAIKRKSYHVSVGNMEEAAVEQKLIDKIRAVVPAKPGGAKVRLSDEERIVRRKACVRRARYRHIKGIPHLDEPSVCEVCGCGGKICMDHDHATHQFRGWLCDDCNIALGRVGDNINVLKALIRYLKKHQ